MRGSPRRAPDRILRLPRRARPFEDRRSVPRDRRGVLSNHLSALHTAAAVDVDRRVSSRSRAGQVEFRAKDPPRCDALLAPRRWNAVPFPHLLRHDAMAAQRGLGRMENAGAVDAARERRRRRGRVAPGTALRPGSDLRQTRFEVPALFSRRRRQPGAYALRVALQPLRRDSGPRFERRKAGARP